MMRRLVRAYVRGATVTASAPQLCIDPLILRAANILPLEEVEVVHSAARFTTFATTAAEGSGELAVPGVRVGDEVALLSWGLLHDGQTLAHKALVVTVEQNRVTSIGEE